MAPVGGSAVVEVIGAERVDASLDPARWQGFGQALLRGGLAIAAEMQRAAKPHHDTGNLERNIHAEGPFGHGLNQEVRIGIGTAGAPEGRPLAFGWKSKSGRQPPTGAIVAWLTRKGFGSGLTDSQLRGRAFVIARAIGRRGYRFGADDWFHKGIEAGRPRLRAIMREAMRHRTAS
jgi:hypothetical protein